MALTGKQRELRASRERVAVTRTGESVKFGNKLRRRRRDLGLTLANVASAAGLTPGFISDVERGKTSPSVASLLRMCNVLNLRVGELFETNRQSIVRKAERRLVNFGGVGLSDFLLSADADSRLQVIWSEMDPGASGGGELYSLRADEGFVLAIRGRISITIGNQEIVLDEGDSLTYDPSLEHTFQNASKKKRAIALYVITPPAY